MRNNLTKIAQAATLGLAITFTLSCSDDKDDGGGCGQTGIINGQSVNYGGETYETVVICNQTWMARNLNYNASGSVCYDNSPANCATYGRLYDWETAERVCPSGWHLPSAAEWDVLMAAVGGGGTAGKKLKATSGWKETYEGKSGNGTDAFGFSALPGGNGNGNNPNYFPDGFFNLVGSYGYWWSATESCMGSVCDGAWSCGTEFNNEYAWIRSGNNNKSNWLSVRCLKN